MLTDEQIAASKHTTATEMRQKARLFDQMAQMVMDHWSEDIIDGSLLDVVQRVFEQRDEYRAARDAEPTPSLPPRGEGEPIRFDGVHVRCGCRKLCGDVAECDDDSFAICRGLRRA